jgi:acyl dehydratase
MYFEEFFVAQHFELNPVKLTSEEIDEFARRYDPQPIHIDTAFAENGLLRQWMVFVTRLSHMKLWNHT